MRPTNTLLILLAILALVVSTCGKQLANNRASIVTVTTEANRLARVTLEPATTGSRLARLFEKFSTLSEAFAYIPQAVVTVTVTVSAADLTPSSHSVAVNGSDSVTLSFEVANGLGRTFKVEGLTSTSMALYRGERTVDVTGSSLNLTIPLAPLSSTVPTATATVPADGDVDVPFNSVISATFSEPLDTRTATDISITLVQTESGASVAGVVSASGATATFLPTVLLQPNTTFTATITSAVRSAEGIPLAHPVAWLFTTRPPVPVVTSTSPANGELGVAVNANVVAAFSESMDGTTLNDTTFTLVRVSDNAQVTGTVAPDVQSATFTPSTSLDPSTQYRATITTGARSLLNVPLAADYSWTFTTNALAPDLTPPSFGGLTVITNVSLSSMQLTWNAASDDTTPTGSIVYLVYMATTSGGENYATPTLTTAPGATSATITGLTAGTVYYFVVLARDEAGSISTTIVELANSYPGIYVDAVSGSDATGTGTAANPYRTITKGISVISGTNVAVFAASGTYDLANGESFPIQLKPAVSLICRGAALSTVIDATGSGADTLYGNEGSVIDQCVIVADAGRTGIDDRIGGSGGTPSRTTVTGGSVTGPAQNGILLSGASTVGNTTISTTGARGIAILAGRPTLRQNAISLAQTGIEVLADTDPTIDGNTIDSTDTGLIVNAAGGRPSVRNNSISNNTTGILISAGAPVVHKNEVKSNTIAGNIVGIEIAGGMPTVSFNTVTANTTGIEVTGGTPTIKSNNLLCNVNADLSALIDGVNASGNTWDHAPPTAQQAPCAPGTDICYTLTVPEFTPYQAAVVGGCP